MTLALGQDLVGVLGPGEGTTALVPAVAEPPDRCHQLLDAGEVTASQRLALDDREAHLDQIDGFMRLRANARPAQKGRLIGRPPLFRPEGPTKEAHRLAMNRLGGLLRSERGGRISGAHIQPKGMTAYCRCAVRNARNAL